ncbi:SERINE PROTEASE [Halorhodospira halochloris]|uniref:SERINE PROTEASE n=1 Tax=Halorhodospira halochloris TaxID=1052 RepID=A0A0X8X9M0_HALHR|nr:patatin-like phospholipase family protein [Halorhodospira halochloris]BAU57980.1 SERINE PROTEASE [Halorhodospira halochloris]
MITSPAAQADNGQPRIGLALGSGGARGLSHLLIFEVLEELSLRPHRISGCSIGAIMGSLYASGMAAGKIRQELEKLIAAQDENLFQNLLSGDWRQWLGFIQPSTRQGGLVESDAFVDYLNKISGVDKFSELEIPLQVVATDYWKREMVVFDSGEIWPAVQASMAMPSLFSPVKHQGRTLIDGGLTNPVPYDLLTEDCDLIIAVNVLGTRKQEDDKDAKNPTYLENIFNTFQVMQYSILQEKMRREEPDFLVSPEISGINVMDFHRFHDILEQGQPQADRLKEELQKVI